METVDRMREKMIEITYAALMALTEDERAALLAPYMVQMNVGMDRLIG